ncbi:MAG TPA: serine/threonine-protein kinase [Kofleriaceae bacterium]|nr:serine/threonine-protein kinase [Kofleriaceae bacterium]
MATSKTMTAGSAPAARGKSDGAFAYEATATGGPGLSDGGSGAGAGASRSSAGVSRALEALFSEPQGIVAGTMIGEYEVTGLLGEGGMGQVFAAVHPIIGKKVAVKVLSEQVAANREVIRRFVAEARAVNQIGHPGIVDVFGFGQHEDGRHYYIMEHLVGRNLCEEMERRGIIPPAELVELLSGALDALEAAHKAGIIHRDLKPDNIFLCDGRKRTAKLLDFGIAKLTGDDSGMARTRTGMAMGTPQYMSPEQCRGSHVDHRTDIYALGVILYRGLCGQFPFNGATPIELFYEHTSEPPPLPSSIAPIPEAFEQIILKCLEKEPEDRFSSAVELDAALRAAVKTPGTIIETDPAEAARIAEAARAEVAAKNPAVPQPRVATAAPDTAAPALNKARRYRKIAVGIAIATALWLVGGGIYYLVRPDSEAKPVAKAAVADAAPVARAMIADAAPPRAVDAAPAPALGGLEIRVNVSGARVWIDDAEVHSRRRRSFRADKLAAGEHRLRVERRGYRPVSRAIDVLAGKKTPVDIDLHRIPAATHEAHGDHTASPDPDTTRPDPIEDENATIGLPDVLNDPEN